MPRWTSRPATATGTRSKSSRGARAGPNSTSPGKQCSSRRAPGSAPGGPTTATTPGVRARLRTRSVVPTLLTDRTEVAELIERLEVHYLANPDGDVRFALLSDWTDAPTESVPGDEETLAAAREGIGRLNSHYGDALEGGQRFLLFHRRRLWNESEQTWMGWERKRGKLHELNRLLRGATDTSFLSAGGAAPVAPPDVRYVITLDADTRLPRGEIGRALV